jgi:hypothetical protein
MFTPSSYCHPHQVTPAPIAIVQIFRAALWIMIVATISDCLAYESLGQAKGRIGKCGALHRNPRRHTKKVINEGNAGIK